MTDWVTIGIIGVVVIFALAIFYKGLKEPIDLILYWIIHGIQKAFGYTAGAASQTAGQVVTYG